MSLLQGEGSRCGYLPARPQRQDLGGSKRGGITLSLFLNIPKSTDQLLSHIFSCCRIRKVPQHPCWGFSWGRGKRERTSWTPSGRESCPSMTSATKFLTKQSSHRLPSQWFKMSTAPSTHTSRMIKNCLQIMMSRSSESIWQPVKLGTSRRWVPMTMASINMGRTWENSCPPRSRGKFRKIRCKSWISFLSGLFLCSKIKIPSPQRMRTIRLKVKLTYQMKHIHPRKLKCHRPQKRMLTLMLHRLQLLVAQVQHQWQRVRVQSRRKILHKHSPSWPMKR